MIPASVAARIRREALSPPSSVRPGLARRESGGGNWQRVKGRNKVQECGSRGGVELNSRDSPPCPLTNWKKVTKKGGEEGAALGLRYTSRPSSKLDDGVPAGRDEIPIGQLCQVVQGSSCADSRKWRRTACGWRCPLPSWSNRLAAAGPRAPALRVFRWRTHLSLNQAAVPRAL